uniref:Uncharacterized protein n=1 Tax=Ciona savignyi TaxID=51511 RepID=H2Y5J7_CIOSA
MEYLNLFFSCRKQQLRFRVRAEGYMRETRGINFSAFVPNAWNHVVLVAPPGGGSVKVYINGDSLGRSVTYRGGGSNTQPSPPQFYLGRNIRGNTWRRGYFNGSFSAIIVWKEALTNAQVASLYQTYLPALQSDVTLSVSLLRHFAPVSARGCFKEPSTIADLYNSRSTNRVCLQGSPFIPLLGFPQ